MQSLPCLTTAHAACKLTRIEIGLPNEVRKVASLRWGSCSRLASFWPQLSSAVAAFPVFDGAGRGFAARLQIFTKSQIKIYALLLSSNYCLFCLSGYCH
jgi:hypothetical protein